ncbi:MAG: rRNA maturation RNase YbeY [Clostridia bacterium]|nr:rRNA maturation RNase YbeY [Clostridia bacterium]
MNDIKIYCEENDFSPLEKAFCGEVKSDCTLSLEIIFTDEDGIRELNARTRGIDAVTDVLSFPALDNILGKELKKEDFPADVDEEDNLFIGSIAICVKRAKEQAEEYGHSYKRELFYLATHGVCHLLGFDHMTDGDKAAMRDMEERVLAKINVTRDGE